MNQVNGEEANFDERRDAEMMANHLKTEQFEQIINADDIRWSLPKLVYRCRGSSCWYVIPQLLYFQISVKIREGMFAWYRRR